MGRTFLASTLLLAAAVATAEPAPGETTATATQAATATPTATSTPTATQAATPAPTQAAADPDPPETPDDAAQAAEIDDQSAELEAIREAEAEAHVQEGAHADARAEQAAASLGHGSPVRARLEEALGREPPAEPEGERGRIALLPEIDHGLEALQAEYDIPIEVNDQVLAYVRFFQSPRMRPHFTRWLSRSHRYLDRFRDILREEGLPEDTVYLAMIESGFANFARSRARAVGPWQFISSTGRTFGLRQDFWVDERRDPEKSARAAARYLKLLHSQTGDWRLAWAGYNAGVGRIFRARARGYDDFWEMAATRGRRVLRAETKGYVPKLMAAAIVAKHPEAFGFGPDEVEPEAWDDYEEVTVPEATLLSVVARATDVPERELLALNPELRRACTPPRPYRLKLPLEAAATFAERWPSIAPTVRTTFDGHVVRRGETLSGIAARYGVPLQGIMEMNRGVSARRLRPGTELLIPRWSGRAVGSLAAAEGPSPAPGARPTPSAAAGRPATWRVRRGDTLWSIARRSGIGLAELCRWNGIEDPSQHQLQVGVVLKLANHRG